MKNHQDHQGRQDRQEEYIQYLYGVIDILKQKLCDAELQYKEYSSKLRQSEKESDLKEKFSLFRESQLSELEDEIYKLKERIKCLTSKMATPSGSRPPSRSPSRPLSRSPSRSPSRRRLAELISLDTLSSDRLLEEINTSTDELHNYALGIKHAGNINDLSNLVERITRASEIIHNRSDTLERGLAATRETLLRQITELEEERETIKETLLQQIMVTRDSLLQQIAVIETRVFQSEENLKGALAEKDAYLAQLETLSNDVDAMGNRVYALRTLCQNQQDQIDNLQNDNNRLRRIRNRCIQEARNWKARLETSRQQRDEVGNRYIAERFLNGRLYKRICALRIELTRILNNPPPPLPPPPPPPINQIWLLFH